MMKTQPLHSRSWKLDRDYEEMRRMSRKLGIPVPLMRINLDSRDRDGNVVGVYDGWSRTFVRNYYNLLAHVHVQSGAGTNTFGQGALAIKCETGFSGDASFQTNTPPLAAYVSVAALAEAGFGIVVGTNTANESYESFKLGAKIATGNGAGQLAYSAQSATVLTYNFATRTWTGTFVRIFNNNSGSTIAVAECGIMGSINAIAFGGQSFGTSGQGILICRDLLAAPVSVLNAGQLTVTYTISLTEPAGPVNLPPIVSNFSPLHPEANANVTARWYEQRDPRNWQSTEAWQRQQYRNFKQ